MYEETVPEEGTFEYKMNEGVEDVPDEEYAGFCAAICTRAGWENA